MPNTNKNSWLVERILAAFVICLIGLPLSSLAGKFAGICHAAVFLLAVLLIAGRPVWELIGLGVAAGLTIISYASFAAKLYRFSAWVARIYRRVMCFVKLPPSRYLLKLELGVYLRTKDHNRLRQLLDSLISEDRSYLVWLGSCELELGNLEAAERAFDESLTIPLARPDALVGKAAISGLRGENDTARLQLEEGIREGYGNVAYLKNSKAFEFFRESSDYTKFLDEVRGNSNKRRQTKIRHAMDERPSYKWLLVFLATLVVYLGFVFFREPLQKIFERLIHWLQGAA